jgi:pimeloyl-ACP methyl ester carboxylesterase
VPFARAADKVRIYYEAHGSGTPLVLAYGIGGNAEMWDVNRDALAARHRLILWEPRGHARSDSPEDPAKYSFERWVFDLKAVLDRLGIRKAHVGGLSLGALIAMDHITDQLRRLKMPVRLIGADRDPSLEPMKVMHRRVRGSRLVVLSPASHFGNRDQPEAWNRTVLEFLARCDRRTRG